MLQLTQRMIGGAAIVLALLRPAAFKADRPTDPSAPGRVDTIGRIETGAPKRPGGALPFVRTELFFGTSRSDGVVSDAEFHHFLDDVVRPRFPDGLTLLKASGHSRTTHGAMVSEESFVVILLYPYEKCDESSERIQEVRELYKRKFDQESVLRVDDPSIVWVSF